MSASQSASANFADASANMGREARSAAMITHRDLAGIVAALYATSDSMAWLYRSNPDANVVMGIVRLGDFLVVACRGSYTGLDWLHDVLVHEIDPPGRPAIKRVHAGFYSGTPEAWDIVNLFNEDEKVIFIGHSLGAARAEILAEHMASTRGIFPHLVVTWGQPAVFKPSPMVGIPAMVSYRNVVAGDQDDVTWSTDIVGYRHRVPFVDVSAAPAARNKFDPFDLHHFALYQGVTPATEV